MLTLQELSDRAEIQDLLVREASYQTTSVYGFGHPLYYDNVIKTLRGEAEPVAGAVEEADIDALHQAGLVAEGLEVVLHHRVHLGAGDARPDGLEDPQLKAALLIVQHGLEPSG